jgi:hypothetical protein
MTEVQTATEILRKHQATQFSDELAFFHQHKREWVAEHRGEFILLGKTDFWRLSQNTHGGHEGGHSHVWAGQSFLVEQILEEEV